MRKSVLAVIIVALLVLLPVSYRYGYTSGENTGYSAGMKEGYDDGYSDGEGAGYLKSWAAGFTSGSVDAKLKSYESNAQPEQPSNSQTVYITQYGECYHSRSNCGNSKTAFLVYLSDAIAQGYRKCSKCW